MAMKISVVVMFLWIPAAKFVAPDRAELRCADAQFAADHPDRCTHIFIKLTDFLSCRHATQVGCRKSECCQHSGGAKSVAAHNPLNDSLKTNVFREKLPKYMLATV